MAVVAQNTNNSTIRSILLAKKLTGLNFTNWFRNLRIVLRTKNIFKEHAKQELFETVNAFHACKQEEGQSVGSYLLKMKSLLDTLERLGYVMPNELGHAMLKLHEKGIPKKVETLVVLAIRESKIQKDKKKPRGVKGKDKEKNKLAYAPKPKISSPPKRDNLAKDSIYHHCKEVGHWRRNCPSYQAELKKRMNASVANTSGYSKETIGYYFYYPLENKIFVSQNAEFFENSLMVQEASGSHGLLKSSGSNGGLELIQEEDTQPSENTTKIHSEVAPIEVLVDLPPNGQTIRSKWVFKKKVDMDDLEEAAYILEIKIIRDRSKRLIAFSQSAYLEKILKRFWMENSKKGYTPMIEKPDYKNSQGAKTPSEKNPGEIHWTAVEAILKYLRNIKDMVLVYGVKPEDELKLSCYDDAKSEYIVAAEASMKAIWMRKFIDGLGSVVPSNKKPMEMLCDNELAIAIANDHGILKEARNFQRKYHYIREVIQEREIVLKKVHTDDNVVDLFTKPMPFNKHYEHVMAIGIVPARSLM
uniref:Retrotransposon protein, putative, Ty1-copia subclass n=1 Tax=Tanacetum cinerariifolium TaxID=118510 RepID=A0A6L2JE64_TANCI|nr:hypothetical protein [Tanacetum cinerariifolium]